MGIALDIIKKLDIKEFDWKTSGEHEVGLIAEEVEKVYPEAIWYKDGKVEGLKLLPLIALTIKAIQEMRGE
jgi:hypothetical protein